MDLLKYKKSLLLNYTSERATICTNWRPELGIDIELCHLRENRRGVLEEERIN